MINLAIVGSRTFDNYDILKNKINTFIESYGIPDMIISGGAKGADTLARKYATDNNIKMIEFLPDWTLGKHAGLLRNTEIIKLSTHVIAFPSKNGSGTQDSINKAKK